MIKIISIIMIAGAALTASSQTLSPEVIANTGAYLVNNAANISLSYTAGEMTMIQTFSDNENILTQGFQQPYEKLATDIIDIAQNEAGSFIVYPNPAIDNVWFGFKLPEEENVNINMYNELGQNVGTVYSSYYESGNVTRQTNIAALAAGIYFMTLTFVSSKDNRLHMITQKFQVIN